ncbi:arylsulfatase B-like [Saccoglossus kowalevskii]|uniref:Arylsulfatase B-like n=1 Tax=Saccoglossus kowalevskii TaxID=10224 RepID=A0ABM0MRS6_SACKO|nr:PREDICTED: arylsulfatase B-like [Saccoglossus kowalevskii]
MAEARDTAVKCIIKSSVYKELKSHSWDLYLGLCQSGSIEACRRELGDGLALLWLLLTYGVCDYSPETHIIGARDGARDGVTRKQPHIVLILAEDLGWNDVGWHNADLKMPILNHLAADGVIFNQSYAQPACTPSRSALFTGYYPFKIQRQHQMLFSLEADGLSLDLKILPEMLKDVGYITHLIGKWHLGYCKEEYLPNKRGFDSFYGWLGGGTDLYTKENILGSGYDFRDNTGVVQESDTYLPVSNVSLVTNFDIKPDIVSFQKEYNNISTIYTNITQIVVVTFMLADRAVDIVMGHYKEYPLFLEFSMALPGKFLKVPQEYEDLYSDIEDERQRKFYESDIDGMDLWKTISKGEPSPRTEFVYNIDDNELSPGAAIRVGDYKLITGNPDLLYPFRLLNRSGDWYNYGDEPISGFPIPPTGNEPPPANVTYLFNIIDDPEERNNLAEVFPNKVEELRHRLDEYREHLVPPGPRIFDPAGDAVNFGGVWSPGWC